MLKTQLKLTQNEVQSHLIDTRNKMTRRGNVFNLHLATSECIRRIPFARLTGFSGRLILRESWAEECRCGLAWLEPLESTEDFSPPTR